MRELKDIINESFSKEYGYRVKIAADCTADHMSKLESALQKYNLVSATPWKRQVKYAVLTLLLSTQSTQEYLKCLLR